MRPQFGHSDLTLKGFFDANLGSDVDTMRSVINYIYAL